MARLSLSPAGVCTKAVNFNIVLSVIGHSEPCEGSDSHKKFVIYTTILPDSLILFILKAQILRRAQNDKGKNLLI
ncbi:MAG: hypothetical protein J7604_24255 [Sporocytophaga sp.]|uniref:hypothetical protein n=1 Tax=Sporocytophaga sp. TaxID=2231183 RepID=UPI001B09262A|nr:hypothetical protein [Sporocytophaga sp.]MBO9703349.1 hypothetical protein [Sporocytophaga sp.]